MDSERYTIRGGTGVDVAMPIAGPGSRSYAFIIDWHIRLIVALAWLLGALLVVNGRIAWTTRPMVLIPPLVIYFLYHPIVELFMRGQTPGKRAAGVRIVDRDGGIPGSGAIVVRNIFRLVDSLPGLYVVGLLTTFISAQRVRIGDMAAGTLLVLDEPSPAKALEEIAAGAAQDDLVVSDLAAQILERWPQLAADRRSSIARELLTKRAAPDQAGRIALLADADLRTELAAVARGGSRARAR